MKAIENFVRSSTEQSGKCSVQDLIAGQEFCSHLFIDENSNALGIGECRCYKRELNGNRGLMTGGIGAASIAGTLPFLNGVDRKEIEDSAAEFVEGLNETSGDKFIGFLIIDVTKDQTGRIKIFEVNIRIAGVNAIASVIDLLKNDLLAGLINCIDGRLDRVEVDFEPKASVVVSAPLPNISNLLHLRTKSTWSNSPSAHLGASARKSHRYGLMRSQRPTITQNYN